jgi:serine/threonine protein phosphatase 1
MSRQYAISDIHGCNETFQAMLDKLAFSRADVLYLLGDYVDRGPDSKGVIDTIWRLQNDGYTVHCLLGNHEEMTCSALEFEQAHPLASPGDALLLNSFGAKRLTEIPGKYFAWMRGLKRHIELPGYILVHAGLNFAIPDPLAGLVEMIWIRNWYGAVNRDWLGDRLIVHGHTPVSVARAREMAKGYDHLPVQDIDCGAALRQSPDFGQLCAFDLTNRNLIFHQNIESA